VTDPIQAVADQILDPTATQNLQYASLRQGVVIAISPSDNSLTMYLSGDTSTAVSGIKCLISFQPTVGDTVWCLKQATDIIAIGKIAVSTAGGFAQAQNFVTASNVITTAGVFFDLSSSPNSVTMTKRYSTSNLFVNMAISGWCDVQSGGLQTAVQIGASDYLLGSITLDMLVDNRGDTDLRSARGTAVGSTVIPSLPAGSVTAKIRIKNGVSGSVLKVDSADYYSLTIQEVL
jgi:hypothetical protein